MSQSFNQSIFFTLDKAHFIECFQQSAPEIQRKDYLKATILALMGTALIFVESDNYYIAYFLVALSIIEVFSIRYRQAWWVWRQLMSKSAQSQVKLTIDDQGITTESEYVNNQILWTDVNAIEQTSSGILLKHKAGTNYLSNHYLSEEMIQFINEQQPTG